MSSIPIRPGLGSDWRIRAGARRSGQAAAAPAAADTAAAAPAADGGGRAAPTGAPPGSLVVCDRRTVHAPLFGTPLPGHEAGPSAATVALYALGVAGVPQIHIDEALWTAAELLGGR